jgi:hypothetical protein
MSHTGENMKVHLAFSAWRSRLLACTGTSCLLLASAQFGWAAPEGYESTALAAAKAWIAQIDAGQYIQSYDAGCDEFHRKVTQDKWVLVLKAFRPAYGKVVSRKEVGHIYQENGVNGLDGECMVITYDTSFSRVKDGYEEVVLKLEDGQWRGAAYQAGTKRSSASVSDDSAPQVDTEVQSTVVQSPPH